MAAHGLTAWALIALCVATVGAETVLTFQKQGTFMSGGSMVQRVYVVDSQGSQMVGLIQRYGSDEASAISNRLFASQPSDDFHSAWLERNLQLASRLQSMVMGGLMQMTAGDMRRPPCPHMTSQLSNPSAMSYMARTRFSPSIFNSLFQVKGMSDDMPEGEEEEDEEEGDYAEDTGDDESDVEKGDSSLDYITSSLLAPEDAQWASEEPSGERWRALGASWVNQPQAGARSAQDERTALFFAPQQERFTSFDSITPAALDDPRWSLWDEDGSLNWDFILFMVLCAGCGFVAASLARSCCIWSYLRRQGCKWQMRRTGQFMTASDLRSPLLAPLAPEAAMAAPPHVIFSNVEVASEHAPQGPEYVTIAYVPLKSETDL